MLKSKVFAIILLACLANAGKVSKRLAEKHKKTPPAPVSSSPSRIFRDVEKDNEVVCKAMKDDVKKQLKLHSPSTSPVTYEDILRQMTLTYRVNLGAGHTKFVTHKYRREILDLVTSIFSIGCPNKYVHSSFVNTVRELAVLYLNELKEPKNSFAKIIPDLLRCKNDTAALKLTGHGYDITGVEVPSAKKGKDRPELVTIFPPHEKVDDGYFLDIIIDSLWWFFSFTFGRCYPYFSGDRAVTMSNFKRAFYQNMLEGLNDRWLHGADWTNAYGPIFGNIPLERTLANLRYCTHAGYLVNQIQDRALVRPISFGLSATPDFAYLDQLNKKTGQVWKPTFYTL